MPLGLKGYGDGWNAYTHALEYFEGCLYCGTMRANLAFKRRQVHAAARWNPWPIKTPENPDDVFTEVDIRARIYRYDLRTGLCSEVYVSPMLIGRNGQPMPKEIGFRGMAVFQGLSDAKPVLYCAPFSNTYSWGPVILRTEDGMHFESVSEPGFGYEGISSFRTLLPFNGRLYTSPIGSTNNVANTTLYPIIFESADPRKGVWREVSKPGFGDPDNVVVFFICEFDNHLYAGTGNVRSGFQLWKTRGEGEAPYHWEKVLEYGAFRGGLNQAVGAMADFRGALYIGTGIQDGGYDRVNRVGPAAGEVLRVFPDGTWEICVGVPRMTPEGIRLPTSGYFPGWNNFFNGYIWRMGVHDGRLYVGTADWSTYLRYINLDLWPQSVANVVREIGIEKIIEHQSGFDLWSTADGDHWTPVTKSGFGNPYNIGCRNIVSTPYGVAIGTVNVFGPEVAHFNGDGYEYRPNPRGGTEIWLGSDPLSDTIRNSTPAGAPPGRTAESYRLGPVKGAFNSRPVSDLMPIKVPLRRSESEDLEFEMSLEELRRRGEQIGLQPLCGEAMSMARELYDLTARGAENVPRSGPVLFIGNNPSIPVFLDTILVSANALYTLNVIAEATGRTPRLLTGCAYFELSKTIPSIGRLVERLGFVPLSTGNARRLLELGEAVLCYPEEQSSFPPYRTRSFEPDFARMAWSTDAAIVPVVFLGTHESHMLLDFQNHQVRANRRDEMAATYLVQFLPKVSIRDHVDDPDNHEQLVAFSEMLRTQIQLAIDQESDNRPLVAIARTLQGTFGEPQEPDWESQESAAGSVAEDTV